MTVNGRSNIKNWKQHGLEMDFTDLHWGKNGQFRPSDLDLFFVWGNLLIIGEIKNEHGELKDGQRKILERLATRWCLSPAKKAIVFYVTHDKRVEDGDTRVNVARTEVQEYFWKGQWHQQNTPLTLREAMDKLLPEDINQL